MGMIKEFKEFALKGNVIDLAVGVIIGAAFGKIVTSMVDDIFMPLVGVMFGKHDMSNYFVTLSGGHYDTLAQANTAGAATLNYGLFINAVITFLIIALVLFIVIKQVNRMTRKSEPTLHTRPCPQCLSVIPIEAKRCMYCAQPV